VHLCTRVTIDIVIVLQTLSLSFTLWFLASNLALLQTMRILFPTAPEVSFVQWSMYAIPIGLLLVLCIWFTFCYGSGWHWSSSKWLYRDDERIELDASVFRKQLIELGSMTYEEVNIIIAMIVMIILWYVPRSSVMVVCCC
jgi:solute carrier family 13 (sodium-dependent dicarboxylate transporter), member 2/3/5